MDARQRLTTRGMLTRGSYLRVLRESAGRSMSQRALAKVAGVAAGTVQRAELDASNITPDTWEKLFTPFDITLGELDARVAAMSRLMAGGELAEHAPPTPFPAPAHPPPHRHDGATGIDADYLSVMQLWWRELDLDDRERVFDFARKLRDDRRALRQRELDPAGRALSA
jgi:transcriptional regulator with XRE-family HTH domain